MPQHEQREHGLEALTVRELRAIARQHRVDLGGLRTKRDILEALRADGLQRLQRRKVTPSGLLEARQPAMPDTAEGILEYVNDLPEHEILILTYWPLEIRDKIAVILHQLTLEGCFETVPVNWEPGTVERWQRSPHDVDFIPTPEGRRRAEALQLAQIAEQQRAMTEQQKAAAKRVEQLIALASSGTRPKKSRKKRWLANAMLEVRDHPESSDRKIAKRVGVDPATLSRSEEYRAAARMARDLGYRRAEVR